MTFSSKLKLLFRRDLRNLYTIKEFAHANKDFLIIVCDPKTDRIFVTYKDRFVNGKIKSATGKNPKVVKTVLRYSRFHHSISDFITAIAETLNLPLTKGNQFYQFLDGAVYNIAKGLRKKRSDRPAKPVQSPFVEESKKV
jgi:hypothetical protein